MKAKISALMDGELSDAELAESLRVLRQGGEALETWREYHLISDALRDTRLLSSGFSTRVAERLAKEPTVLAPASVPRRPPARWVPLSAAASFAAVALVGWLAFAPQSGTSPGGVPQLANAPVQSVGPVQSVPVAVETAAVPLSSATNDYLLAHQNYSPRSSWQGVAPYVRTVSETAHPR